MNNPTHLMYREIVAMLALSDAERTRLYGTNGWKLLLIKFIAKTYIDADKE